MKKLIVSAAFASAIAAVPVFAQDTNPNNATAPARAAQAQAAEAGQAQPRLQGERPAAQPRPQQGERVQIQPQTGERVQAQKPQVQDTQEADFNQQAAACLIIGNQAEVAIAEASVEKIQNPKVREFAEQLVKDHQQFIAKLKPLAPQAANLHLDAQKHDAAASADRNARNADNQNASADKNASSPTDPAHANANAADRSASETPADKWLRVQKTSAENCVNATIEKMQALQGVEFDKAFLGSQVGGHIHAVAHLQALHGEVDGQLAELVSQAEEKTSQHLQHAEQLMKQLKDVEPGERAATQSEAPATKRENQ